ncbi:BON domain-containing protein [Legionella yabuuchiae]|uniref:BON domain-containing protein n=1 Tax=Legionella yabuuchiae TaxID=376727 RepID=UPI00105487E7|nr:BON domain-containing protein [Legionella yabuuchiae]
MSKIIRSILAGCALMMLFGCQYMPGEGLFQLRPNDPQISTSVQQALKSSPDLRPFTFHVETSEGVVYLSGYVKTIRQSDTAEMIARQVPGVASVENNIVVRK